MKLLKSIKRIFQGKRLKPIATDITERSKIISKLKELCQRHQACEIVVFDEYFTSIFLETRKSEFLIDTLLPRHSNSLLEPGEEVQVRFFDFTLPYQFQSRFVGSTTLDGGEALAFALPEILQFVNRRRYQRVTPSAREPVKLLLEYEEHRIQKALARDISEGGVSTLSEEGIDIAPHHHLRRIEIQLPDSSLIKCRGRIQRITGSVLGIQLTEIEPVDRRSILEYVRKREAEKGR